MCKYPRITRDNAWSEVVYSPNKNRVKRRDSTGRETLYVGAHYEQTTWGGITTRLHRIGDFAVYVEKLGLQQDNYIQYLHRDHLGSVVAKTTDKEPDLERMANGPWGERRFWAWDGPTDPQYDPVDNRGFTGHEHLDPVGLIHMNGRVYDPELGRFLSPDPFVQAPLNTQSYNRYSYAFNNPLSYTDPSGYTSEKSCGYGTVNNKCAGGLDEKDTQRIEEQEESKHAGITVVTGYRSGSKNSSATRYSVQNWSMNSGRYAGGAQESRLERNNRFRQEANAERGSLNPFSIIAREFPKWWRSGETADLRGGVKLTVDMAAIPIKSVRLISDSLSAGEVVWDASSGNYREAAIGAVSIMGGEGASHFMKNFTKSDMFSRGVSTGVQRATTETLADDCLVCK